jgi:hypothetical protein
MADQWLTLEDIKKNFDTDYTNNQTTRRNASDDLLFANVAGAQWDSTWGDDCQLSYRGEFDILRKARREVLADMRANPVQVNFEPKADSREGDADFLDGLYLTDDRGNTSIEAYDNAAQETVDCGIGGWKLRTEYEDTHSGERHQVIRRDPIYEFNNTCFPDSNAKLLDKSDAKRWTILHPYSLDGYKELHLELTGEETDCAPANFASPECSYVFPWIDGNEIYYVAEYYHRSKVKDKILTFSDPFGGRVLFRESDLMGRGEDEDIDLLDTLIEEGYELVSEKKITRWQVKCYIASGEAILSQYVVAGSWIPIVPMYGERAFVEGGEVYEGLTRKAKDPQRLYNFALSYIGETVSSSPRKKPIFHPEQIAGFESMYAVNGADNNYPFLYQHRLDANGQPLPPGPVGQIEGPELSSAVEVLLGVTKSAVEDVANPGLPKNIADADISGRALEILQARLDNQSAIYQDHLKHAKRYDAVIYASMASQVYDAPRRVTITLPDGSRKVEEVMSQVMDEETGELVVLNDLTNMEFEVYADIGPSYTSKREKTVEQLGEMAAAFAQSDPAMQKALMLKQMTLVDGVNFDDVKAYANKQLMLQGIKEPETEEEIAFMEAESQKEQAPDPAMELAKAEQMKAQAQVLKAQTDQQKVQFEKEQFTVDTQIRVAETRADLQEMKTKERLNNSKANTEDAQVALAMEELKLKRAELEFEREKLRGQMHMHRQTELVKVYNARTNRFEESYA